MDNELRLHELLKTLTTKQKLIIILEDNDEVVFKGEVHQLINSPVNEALRRHAVYTVVAKKSILFVKVF